MLIHVLGNSIGSLSASDIGFFKRMVFKLVKSNLIFTGSQSIDSLQLVQINALRTYHWKRRKLAETEDYNDEDEEDNTNDNVTDHHTTRCPQNIDQVKCQVQEKKCCQFVERDKSVFVWKSLDTDCACHLQFEDEGSQEDQQAANTEPMYQVKPEHETKMRDIVMSLRNICKRCPWEGMTLGKQAEDLHHTSVALPNFFVELKSQFRKHLHLDIQDQHDGCLVGEHESYGLLIEIEHLENELRSIFLEQVLEIGFHLDRENLITVPPLGDDLLMFMSVNSTQLPST